MRRPLALPLLAAAAALGTPTLVYADADGGDDGPSDETPPEVKFLSPTDGESFDGPITLTIEVEAYDPESWVEEITLVDGGLQETGEATPCGTDRYCASFEYTFQTGMHALRAEAWNTSMLFGSSKTIEIAVFGEGFAEPACAVARTPGLDGRAPIGMALFGLIVVGGLTWRRRATNGR